MSPTDSIPDVDRNPPGPDTPAESSALAWVAPFVVFMVWLAGDKYLPIRQPAKELLRDAVLLISIVGFSRRLIPVSAPFWIGSAVLGLAVSVMWVAPDYLMPQWRSHWLFQNALTGHFKNSIPPNELTPLLLFLRTMRASLLVPVIEELFWRGWLPRWIQDENFNRVPLGQYSRFAFWATALLFAAEHGPYWEVGLAAGIAYNWWMRRTRSLGDLMLAHGVTNLALAIYVIRVEDWRFWM